MPGYYLIFFWVIFYSNNLKLRDMNLQVGFISCVGYFSERFFPVYYFLREDIRKFSISMLKPVFSV